MTWQDAPELLKVDEAALLLRCSEKTVYRRLKKGRWGAFAWKVGTGWRIEKDGLREHLASAPIRRPADDLMPKTRRARFDALVEQATKGVAHG